MSETAATGSVAAGWERAGSFEDILREIDRLRSASEALEAVARNHPDTEDGLITVSGNIRSIATVLDIFVLIRGKSGDQKEDLQNGPRYLM